MQATLWITPSTLTSAASPTAIGPVIRNPRNLHQGSSSASSTAPCPSLRRHKAASLIRQQKLSCMLWHLELQMPSWFVNCWKRSRSTSALCNPHVVPILVFRTQFGASVPKLYSPLKKQALATMFRGCGPNNNPTIGPLGFAAKSRKKRISTSTRGRRSDGRSFASHMQYKLPATRRRNANRNFSCRQNDKPNRPRFEIFWCSLTAKVRGW